MDDYRYQYAATCETLSKHGEHSTVACYANNDDSYQYAAEENAEAPAYTITEPECIGYHHGQTDLRILAKRADGRLLGKLDYSVFGQQLHVQHVGVEESHRRQRIATAMYEKMLDSHPGLKIRSTLRTDLGAAFRRAFDSQHPDSVAEDMS